MTRHWSLLCFAAALSAMPLMAQEPELAGWARADLSSGLESYTAAGNQALVILGSPIGSNPSDFSRILASALDSLCSLYPVGK